MSRIRVAAGIAFALALLCASPGFGQTERKPAPPGQAQRINVTIGWGDRLENCNKGKGICIIISLRCAPARMAGAPVQAEARLEGNEMALELTSAPPAKTDRLAVDRDIAVDSCTSAALGYESLTILKGDYAFNAAAGKFGTIRVRVSGKKSSGPPKA